MRCDQLHPEVRKRLHRYTTDHRNHYGVVPSAPTELPLALGDHGRAVDLAMMAMGRMAASPSTDVMSYLRRRTLTRQEALSSSAMEGTQSTLDAILGLDSDTLGGEASRQVRSYAIALDQMIPEAARIGPDFFTLSRIQDLHRHVMQEMSDYRDKLGALRSKVVWIGGTGRDIAYSIWNPPGPEHLEACLQDSVHYMRANGPHAISQPLLLRLAIAHAHFEAVHPFLDGNGRVGRLLIPLMMAAEGIEPVHISPWIEANKALYYEALKSAQQQLDPAPLTGFIAHGIIETEKELATTETALSRIVEIWRETTGFRHGSSAERLLGIVAWLPVLSVRTAAEALGVTTKAAGDGIALLCNAGILRERTGYARNRIFEAQDVLRIISRPFGVAPILPGDEPEDSLGDLPDP